MVLLIFIQLFILHKHNSNCQIKQKEGAYNDTEDEEKANKPCVERILKKVHDFGPALHSNALENC